MEFLLDIPNLSSELMQQVPTWVTDPSFTESLVNDYFNSLNISSRFESGHTRNFYATELAFIMCPILHTLKQTNNKRMLFKGIREDTSNIDYVKNYITSTSQPNDYVITVIEMNGTTPERQNVFNNLDADDSCRSLHVSLYSAVCTLKRTHQIRVYLNATSLYIITNDAPQLLLYKIISLIPAAFNLLDLLESNGVPKELYQKLGTSLIENNATEWAALYNSWLDNTKIHLRTTQITFAITTSIANIVADQRNKLKEYIGSCERNMNDGLQKYICYRQEKEKYLLQLLGLDTKESPSYKDFIEYIIKHKPEVKYVSGLPEILHFEVIVPLNNYEQDTIRQFVDSPRSNHINGDPLTHKFFTKVFLEEAYTLYCYVAFNWLLSHCDIENANITGTIHYGIPNTHIDQFNCWGNNRRPIMEALEKSDYIFALEQSLAACRGFNVSDAQVCEKFIHQVVRGNLPNSNCNVPAFKDNTTGQWYTIREFKELLKK